jgi:hypothetical protein
MSDESLHTTVKEPTGEELLLKCIRKAKEGKTDAEIEAKVEKIIEDVKNLPRSPYYWDHNDGWKEDVFIARVARDIAQNRERLNIITHSSILDRGRE